MEAFLQENGTFPAREIGIERVIVPIDNSHDASDDKDDDDSGGGEEEEEECTEEGGGEHGSKP